jgi:hypothetical protein
MSQGLPWILDCCLWNLWMSKTNNKSTYVRMDPTPSNLELNGLLWQKFS